MLDEIDAMSFIGIPKTRHRLQCSRRKETMTRALDALLVFWN